MSSEEKGSEEARTKERELFSRVCRLARRLMDSGKLRIRIIYPSRVDLRVAREDLEAAATEEGMSADDCRRILDREVALLLAASLSGDRGGTVVLAGYLAGRVAAHLDRASVDTAIKEVEARQRLVEGDLLTQRLRDRYLLKQTSKTNPLTGWYWEVSLKEYDDGKGALSGLRHATVRLHARRRTGAFDEVGADYLPVTVQTNPVEAFAFDCDLEEAEDLRDTFARITTELRSRDALDKADAARSEDGASRADR